MSDRKSPSRDPRRREEWRARIPESQRVVEEVAPRVFELNAKDRAKDVPDPWKTLVKAMQRDVHAEADSAEHADDSRSVEERRGYYWSWKIGRIADMVDYLMDMVRDDIGVEQGTSIASMVLVRRAMLHLQLELQDGGTKDGREDAEENHYRVFRAITALNSRFDDIHLRRLRALQVADIAARMTRIPTAAEVESSIEDVQQYEIDPDRHRDWMENEQPALLGVMARDWLAQVDERFRQLDPLAVLEEFHEAEADARGGRSDGGEGKTGPARAVARLALQCGALEAKQEEGEDFDRAVERVRSSLLVSRSRIRKALRTMPGRVPPGERNDDDAERDGWPT